MKIGCRIYFKQPVEHVTAEESAVGAILSKLMPKLGVQTEHNDVHSTCIKSIYFSFNKNTHTPGPVQIRLCDMCANITEIFYIGNNAISVLILKFFPCLRTTFCFYKKMCKHSHL